MSKMQIIRLRTDDGLRIVGKWWGVVGVTWRGSERRGLGANRIDRQHIYGGWGGGCHMLVDGFEFIFSVYAPACLSVYMQVIVVRHTIMCVCLF